MKIGEAQKVYSARINELWNRKRELMKQQKENEKKQDYEANRGVVLELSSVDEQYDKMHEFMEQFSLYKMTLENMETAKKQGEAVKGAADDMAKCLEIARCISNGDRVPAYDEKKLMDYSFELYMASKNTAMMNANKKHKDHDSLWKDEEDEKQGDNRTSSEIVNDMECAMEMPDVSMSEGSVEGE